MKQQEQRLTEDIFNYITTMTRGKADSPSCRAAHAVLLEGMSQAEAVESFKISKAAVSKTVRRYREAEAEGRRVFAQQSAWRVQINVASKPLGVYY